MREGARRGPGAILKRILVGRPLAHEEARHQLLPKVLALPVFASDALSSNAYATEEILIVLSAAGAGALSKSIPIAVTVAVVMTIVIASYRQTVQAYPGGGGAYIVARENLGEMPGLIAAAALLIDYVLTVSVSIAAGAFALASLEESLLDHRVALSLGFIVLVTIANLRGARESGTLFAVPTYAFIFSVLAMLGVGAVRCLSACPQAETAGQSLKVTSGLTMFLVLRAFSSGSTALTGVEAIANGVPAFRGRRPRDQARNASQTLAALGVISITMFLGITILANAMHVRPTEERSVVAQVAHATFGGGFGFVAVQITTALILVLAANTAYQDFPRLSSILARDRYMPRQFINRGDRLVFSNGIMVLAALASLLIYIFHAEVTRLIQLYVVGVFTSFTLSQIGMVVRWRKLRSPASWRRSATMNAIGAAATGIVLAVVTVTKFPHGAWIVVAAVPVIVLGFKAINRHYQSIARQLRLPETRPRRIHGTRAVVLVPRIDQATLRAVGYARALRPLEVRAVHFADGSETDRTIRDEWEGRRVGVPLEIADCADGDLVASVRSYVRGVSQAEDEYVTVVVPELLRRAGWLQFIRERGALLLKAALLFERRVVVTDVPVVLDGTGGDPPDRGAIAPTRVVGVVLVSAVHNATLRALAYAQSLRLPDLRAVTFNVEPDETEKVMEAWSRAGVAVPLEIVDSPYRGVVEPLRRYVRKIRAGGPDTVVSVILPEFVVRKRWHQILHNQTALAVKAALLFESGVVLTSVPFHLE